MKHQETHMKEDRSFGAFFRDWQDGFPAMVIFIVKLFFVSVAFGFFVYISAYSMSEVLLDHLPEFCSYVSLS
jgi:hypothetical protein